MISFPVIFINLLSIVMMVIVTLSIWNIRDENAAKQLFLTSMFMLLWSIGSFADLLSFDMHGKLLWRNFTQIGVFFTPVASLMFAIVYSGMFYTKRKLIAYVSYGLQSIGILLVWTDGYHHLIRESVTILKTDLLESLVVVPTILAKFLISINILFSCIAFGILALYAIRTTSSSRKASLIVLGGMLVTTSYSLLKVVMVDSFAQIVPISGIFALSALCMLLGIYRYNLLKIAPLAREQVFHFLGDGLVIASAQGKLLEANQAALSMMGPTLSELSSNLGSDVPLWQEALTMGREGAFSFYRSEKYYDCSVYAIKTRRNATIGTISLLKDSTEQKQKNDLLRDRAERDGLTGIYNRQTFIEQVEKRLNESGRSSSLVFFDIDHFKSINDRYGHMTGDQMLQAVVACSYKTLVRSDIMGRIGGEEFAIFHASTSEEETLAWAENVRKQVEQTVLHIDGNAISCTISIGLCFSHTANFDEMFRCADKDVYRAKDAGRNCIRHSRLD